MLRRNRPSRSDKSQILDFAASEPERVSPEAFLDILETRQSELKSFEFVPPRLGDKHFGYFRIEWKWPRFSLRA